MPYFKVFINVEKFVDPNEGKYIRNVKDEDRYLEIKKEVDGFNVIFDLTVDCNDDGELGTLLNIHSDPRKFGGPFTNQFDRTEYSLSSEEFGLHVDISIEMEDKDNNPFTTNMEDNILGFCILVEDYAKKIKKTKSAGIIYEKYHKNAWFEIKTVIVLHKRCCHCSS
jgi:hypothetical protein